MMLLRILRARGGSSFYSFSPVYGDEYSPRTRR